MEAMTESRTRVFVFAAVSLGLAAGIFVLDLLTPPGIPIWLFYLAPIAALWALTPSRVGLFALVMLIGTRAIPPNLVTVGHAT